MSLRSVRRPGRGSLASVFVGGLGLNGLTLALTVVSGVLAARALAPSGRGALAAILIAPNLAPYVFSLGVQRAASYHLARKPEDAGRILAAWAGMLVPASLVAVVVLELLVPVLLHAQSGETQHLARIWVLTAVLALYGRLANGMLLGTHRFGTYYFCTFAQPAVIMAGYVGLWVSGHLTLEAALVVNVAAAFTSLGVAAVAILPNCSPARPSTALARETLWYGVRAQGGELGGIVNARVDALVIPSVVAATQVGYYSVASNVSWIVFTAAATISTVVLPAAARRRTTNVPTIVASFYFMLAVSAVIAGLLALIAPVLVPALYGSSFEPAVLPLEILLLATVALASAVVFESGLGALDAPWRASVAQLLGSAITVAGLLIVLPRGGGIVGAAIVSCGAYLTTFVVALVLFKRTAQVPWRALRPARSHLDVLLERADAFAGTDRRVALPRLPVRGRGAVTALVVGLVSVGVGILVPLSSGTDLGHLEPWTMWWLLFAVCVFVLARNASGLLGSSRSSLRRLGSSVVALGTLAAVILPGAQLLTGATTLRLGRYGLELPDLDAALGAAFAIFLVAVVGVWLGESVGLHDRARPRPGRVESAWVYGTLIAIALGTRLVVGASTVADRAAEGKGIQGLLGWGVPLAVAIGVLNRHWGSRWLAALSFALAAYQLFGGTSRSPLFLIAIAVSLRAVAAARRSRRSARSIVVVIAVASAAVVVAIGFSDWRHDVTIGQPASLTASLVSAAENPFRNFTERTQLDSLEGLTLSMQVDRRAVGGSWTDPSKALVNFVPRKLWPDKPDWLSPTITHQYLEIGGNAGIFVSGAGYLYILYGGAVGVLIGFVLLGFVSRRLYARLEITSTGTLLLTYFWMRFFFGGDAYDLFAVLGLAGLVLLARGLAWALRALLARPVEPVPEASA
ncbi:MAG TPA: oligosaccharide flippase family protein [Gaiellaceae bacterium]